MSEVRIRAAGEADFPAIVDVERDRYGDHGFSPYFLRMAPRLFGDACVVAEREGRVVGYALGGLEAGTTVGWLLSVAVVREAAGAGVGRALCHACLEALDALGATRVWLSVAPGNAGARHLYESLGFAPDRLEADFYGPGEDRLLFRRPA